MAEKVIISEGKTLNEAIESGLKELNCKRSDDEINEIKDNDKKIFYSILEPRKVKVKLKLINMVDNSDNDVFNGEVEKAIDILKDFLNKFKVNFNDLNYDISNVDNLVKIDFIGKDAFSLIGYHGDCLNALQIILQAVLRKKMECKVKLVLNVGDYIEKRIAALKDIARKLEKEVIETNIKKVLKPMNSFERKVIHTELQDSEKVVTYSIGEEPYRKVVIDLSK